MGHLRHPRAKVRWVVVVLGTMLLLSSCLLHGEVKTLGEYSDTLNEIDFNMQEIKQKNIIMFFLGINA